MVPFVGPAAWFVFGTGVARVTGAPRPIGPDDDPDVPAAIGPDDDPEFLRRLGRRRTDRPEAARPGQRLGRPPYECRPLNQMFTPK